MRTRFYFCLLACLSSCLLLAQDYPKAEISNGLIHAELMLPDSQNGSYRGTRFDWSGIISSLQFNGHEYFGRWYEHHDPKIHDAITGPVEAFQTNDKGWVMTRPKPAGPLCASVSARFANPRRRNIALSDTYEIVDPGKWTIQAQRPDRVHSAIKVGAGIRVRLPQDRPAGEGKTATPAGTLVEKHRPQSD